MCHGPKRFLLPKASWSEAFAGYTIFCPCHHISFVVGVFPKIFPSTLAVWQPQVLVWLGIFWLFDVMSISRKNVVSRFLRVPKRRTAFVRFLDWLLLIRSTTWISTFCVVWCRLKTTKFCGFFRNWVLKDWQKSCFMPGYAAEMTSWSNCGFPNTLVTQFPSGWTLLPNHARQQTANLNSFKLHICPKETS